MKGYFKKKGEKIMTKRFSFTLAEGATHVAMPNSKLNFGFTLAEVLITLGIIGVVAAMTMPTLMNQTNGAQYKAAYKKALSAIGQAVTLNVALDGGNFADTVAGTAGTTALTADTDKVTIANILGARMNVVKTDAAPAHFDATSVTNGKGVALTDVDTTLYFNDGSMFTFKNAGGACKAFSEAGNGTICEGYIDVNGLKGPNKVVTCSTGTTTKDTVDATTGVITPTDAACTVASPTDIYPVFYYDQTIVPSTNAAKAVLYAK